MKPAISLAVFCLLLLATGGARGQAFDHSHAQWTALLKQNVAWQGRGTSIDGVASTVDYAGLKRDRARVSAYTQRLASVKQKEFDAWTTPQKHAFLINAYNAYTVELIIGTYPKLKSIKDLGSVISSPWSKAAYPLLGKNRSLDDIEHKLLRGAPGFSEPRIHFAVNCASIGCPALRPEAFAAASLDGQLEDQTRRFLQDTRRNRFDRAEGSLLLSRIFDWYREDFEKGFLGARDLEAFLARYAGSLGMTEAEKKRLLKGEIEIEYGDYDWSLNVRK